MPVCKVLWRNLLTVIKEHFYMQCCVRAKPVPPFITSATWVDNALGAKPFTWKVFRLYIMHKTHYIQDNFRGMLLIIIIILSDWVKDTCASSLSFQTQNMLLVCVTFTSAGRVRLIKMINQYKSGRQRWVERCWSLVDFGWRSLCSLSFYEYIKEEDV